MNVFSAESSDLRLEINQDSPQRIRRIVHRSSGREVAADTKQSFLVRSPERLSEPFFLTELRTVDVSDDVLTFVLEDPASTFELRCRISATVNGLEWSASLNSSRPSWLLEWRLDGLDLRSFVVPALGGQTLGSDMPAGVSVAYKYPFWWQSQFAIGEIDDQRGMWLRTMESDPRLKVLRVARTSSSPTRFALGLAFESEGPLDGGRELSASWYLDGYSESWTEPAEIHREWMGSAFGARAVEEHPHFPKWANDVNFILEIWGMSKESPDPKHTFDEMIERTREFAKYHDPTRTLLYLPGFAEGGIDSNVPDYNPAPGCGGRDGFGRLVDAVHELGFRVMIHTNVLALAYSHPLYERFKQFQVIDCFGRPQGWGNDIDGDWLHEPFFAYVNPGHPEWTEHMAGVFEDLIGSFDLDGIFLDQTLLAFNVSRGPNFMRGMREHVERLQARFPDVLFAGEGQHELVFKALPMAQIHGLDSIAGVHGLEGARDWRRVHPISAFVFGPYTRLTAHLLTKHPTSPIFERQEAAYAQLGIIPALVLYDRSQKINVPQLQQMLQRADALGQQLERTLPST